jgi:hypothetical protein
MFGAIMADKDRGIQVDRVKVILCWKGCGFKGESLLPSQLINRLDKSDNHCEFSRGLSLPYDWHVTRSSIEGSETGISIRLFNGSTAQSNGIACYVSSVLMVSNCKVLNILSNYWQIRTMCTFLNQRYYEVLTIRM